MRGFLTGGAIAAFCIASVAAAQPAPPPPPGVAQGTAPAMQAPMPPPPPGMRQMQVRIMSDHVMTRDEVAKHVGGLFARLDADHDGFITKDEVEAVHAKMEAAMAKVGDVDKHLAERGVMMGDKGATFDRLDTNHDGVISRQEFTAGGPGMRQERVIVMHGPDGAPGAPSMDGHPGMEMKMRIHGMGMGMGGFGMGLFAMADANHDGRVSLAEAQAAALAHFDKADLNHDGKITPEERAQAHQVMRIEHHPS